MHAAVPDGATIVELGAGAGRVTRGLLELGHEVVAVDESPEMLAHIRGARTICASIETLSLAERFDVVLLASYLVNETNDSLRASWLAACERQLAPDGCVIVQRHGLSWFDRAQPYERVTGGITLRLREVSRPTPDLLAATMEYEHDGRRWTHSYTHCRMDDDRLEAELARAGLRVDSYLTDDRGWLRARR
ncbi:bifunctional 2-polyprenyl-6-hydroxyphenol methylase/3-demethylubiquinol 3-O-methyltransferase UbiG [Streptomyces sp. TS71-3]|uniref:class I SAM-dependent methyltransferase n=1 Tax=Streptomyces sp. TS71-3 TaxID=2733862 RepID=UPI0020181C32|nr:class I SAM-dependent methyltransferase [Streptomyces sp. TS71-3]